MHKRTDTDEIVGKHVLRRLELCHRIGNGAHGMVWKAIEKRIASCCLEEMLQCTEPSQRCTANVPRDNVPASANWPRQHYQYAACDSGG